MSYVLVTGASSGIGKVFAEEYASRGRNLILVARSAEKLDVAEKELKAKHGIEVITYPCDLSKPQSAAEVHGFCSRNRFEVDTLVNNAGFNQSGPFNRLSIETHEQMITLHITTLVKLTHLFLPEMLKRNHGEIINLSSILAFQGVPYSATYAATKAFVLVFSESLREEVRKSGIKVTALCPGLTETGIFDEAGIDPHKTMLPVGRPLPVVRAAINAVIRNQAIIVPGFINKILIHTGRLLPRWLMLRVGLILSRNEASMEKALRE